MGWNYLSSVKPRLENGDIQHSIIRDVPNYFVGRGPCPHKFEIYIVSVIELTSEKLPLSPYFPMWWVICPHVSKTHYDDVIMSTIASQITSLTIVYSTIYSGADQSKHQSSASLAFVWGIHRGPVNSPHKWPVTRKMFPFDDVIMLYKTLLIHSPTSTVEV